MVSKATDSATKLRDEHGELVNDAVRMLPMKINQLKKQIQAERTMSIKDKLVKNGERLQDYVSELLSAMSTREAPYGKERGTGQKLANRIEHPVYKHIAFDQGYMDKDQMNSHEMLLVTTKLPFVEKLPPYNRNQRMAEDQSVVGRRRIYYDQRGSEALVCSDSEDDIAEPEEEKHEFSEGEDRILWMTLQEHGVSEEVVDLLSQVIGGTGSEIKERYDVLKDKYLESSSPQSSEGSVSNIGVSLEKSLSTALDSLDNLFCRRCMMFDCHLHGCSQPLVYPSEKQPFWSQPAEERKPCSDNCYLKSSIIQESSTSLTLESSSVKEYMKVDKEERTPSPVNMENAGTENSEDALDETKKVFETATSNPDVDHEEPLSSNISISDVSEKQKTGTLLDTATCELTLAPDDSECYPCKKQKHESDSTLVTAIDGNDNNMVERPAGNASIESLLPNTVSCKDHFLDKSNKFVKDSHSVQLPNLIDVQVEGMQSLAKWELLERELYLKGIEMFGKDSCLIARNLLSGLKTCTEVYIYMHAGGASMPNRSVRVPNSFMQEDSGAEIEYTDQDVPTRSRVLRRRGKTRKLKYSWKSAGHPSLWKRIADGKNQTCKQYIPCGCQSVCGKQCPCLQNGTCCEKYCGCSKSCKNRFRGCHCAKSQCRSRQCPCFAAGRECDPDVCRNCWVSCGDGSLGEPPRRSDGQCGNMRLLLRQQQRILLGKSDVAGWGAFLKNPVNKNDYLGEYTGELISHREADKRGKIYDRANSSFLFDLNDQYVLDAFRKGDKLKFANHSSNPNCYAKVMLVAGDHRVGIFAKEHIEASEELFYDYCYGPDQAPMWARKSEGSKRDDSSVSQGRARKHQSH